MKSSSISRILLALLLVASAPARAGLAEGRRCLDGYDLRCAIRERDALLAAGASDPASRDFIAETYFHEGRYADALALYAELKRGGYAFDPHAPPFEAAAEAAKDFVETDRDDLAVRRAPGIDVILVDEAFEVMAKAVDTYDALLGGRPDFPVRLDIYPDGTRFIAASGLPAEAVRTTGVIALSKWNRLLVTSPRALPRGYAWKDTVAHEYIHLVVAYRTNDHTPVWLQEGLAKYFEGAWRGEEGGLLSVQQQTLLAQAVHDDAFVPFEKFKHSMAYLDSPADAALAFAQVSTMVRYLVETQGKNALPTVLDHVRDGEDAESAFAAAAGEPDFDSLLASWKSWLRTMPLVAERIESLPVVLDNPADEFEGDPALENREDLKKFARIGDLLRERSLYAAALVEYDKAMDPDGPSSPTLFARRATCYSELGESQKALDVVDEGVRLYPEFALLQVSRARILDALGRVPDATTAWLAAHDLNPFDPEVQDALVKDLLATGRNDLAARHKRYASLLKSGGIVDVGGTPATPLPQSGPG
jgi:tetratricopeptide (TPR) repeat protein